MSTDLSARFDAAMSEAVAISDMLRNRLFAVASELAAARAELQKYKDKEAGESTRTDFEKATGTPAAKPKTKGRKR